MAGVLDGMMIVTMGCVLRLFLVIYFFVVLD